jgi:hypothetical protein
MTPSGPAVSRARSGGNSAAVLATSWFLFAYDIGTSLFFPLDDANLS